MNENAHFRNRQHDFYPHKDGDCKACEEALANPHEFEQAYEEYEFCVYELPSGYLCGGPKEEHPVP